jgi:hypothetical protein
MEINIFCITLGLIMAVLLVGIGVQIGRSDSRQLNDDSDVRIYVPDRDRNRGSDYGQPQQMDPEEVTNILYLFRIGATAREKQVIDYLIDKEERENTHEEQNQA